MNLIFVKINRFEFGPIYTNLIENVVVAYRPIFQYSRVNFFR